MREVELKSVAPDPDAVAAALSEAGARLILSGTLRDVRYDMPDRSLMMRDHVLRMRVFTNGRDVHASLEWKGPTGIDAGYKVREEISGAIGDAAAIANIVRGLGYVVIREIDREIAQFACEGAAVRIERYPRMDALVEVEGAPASIEAAIAATGLPREGFTAERLNDFVVRYELRTGNRAAVSDRELAGDYRYAGNG
jgi:predicted adenylyl cyclase CyaB